MSFVNCNIRAGVILAGLLLCGAQLMARADQKLEVVVAFNGTNGYQPSCALEKGADGAYYGTTQGGGPGFISPTPGNAGYGTIFRITTDGTFSNIYNFAPSVGSYPVAGLTAATDGYLYGSTTSGGSNGFGTIFRITTNGVLTTLYGFPTHADQPQAALVQASDGALYGSTAVGGATNLGSVFRITTNGVFSQLYVFYGGNGANPAAPLIQGTDGNLYGTTAYGGTAFQPGVAYSGFGTVFQMTTAGSNNTLRFFQGTDGTTPSGPLLQGADGALYGTTAYGPTNAGPGNGVVFRVTTNGAMVSLPLFTGATGSQPMSGFLVGQDGNFYGTTAAGGSNGAGSVFVMTPDGSLLTSLASFNYTNGSYPANGLVQWPDGNFYGTTMAGGSPNDHSVTNGNGTIFRLISCSASLAPAGTNIPAAAFTGSFTVSNAGTCAWTPVPSTNWIHIVSGGGSGSGVVNFTVDANFGVRSRTATIGVQDQLFTIRQATFIPTNAFPKFSYFGLYYPDDQIAHSNSGSFTITTTVKGKYTGQLQNNGTRYSIAGQFDDSGVSKISIPRRKLPSLTLALLLDPSADSSTIAGTLTDGNWNSTLLGYSATYNTRTNPAPQQGLYTMILPGSYGSTNLPGGDSYASVTVSSAGALRVTGKLADGTAISQSVPLVGSGQWPLYVPIYGTAGSLSGWINFTNGGASDLVGGLHWIKQTATRTKYYPSPFDLEADVVGSAYHKPLVGQPILNLASPQVTLSGGNLTNAITNSVTIDMSSKVTDLGTNKLKLTFTLATGLFRGTVMNPATKRAVSFNGVVLQNQTNGSGWFLGTNQAGVVTIGE
jgi:uncharacterized repeat protein (TIGR03803 family)